MYYLTVDHTEDNDADLWKFYTIIELLRFMSEMGITSGFVISDTPNGGEPEPEEYTMPEGYEGK